MKRIALGVTLAASPLLLLGAANPSMTPAKARRFKFTYDVTVDQLPASAHRVRIWIPLASSDANQTVAVVKKSGSAPLRITREHEYGDRILYAEISNPKRPSLTFTVEYLVTRREFSRGDYASLMHYNGDPAIITESLKRFLEPDRLVPIDGKIADLARSNTQGHSGTIEKAYAIYNYVFRTLRYDKSGTGWGRGDALWACDSKHGNCTDFHSLFIGMMRAENIPARFEIGFPLPEDKAQGAIAGYHCWAEFYVHKLGWVPVDISEAWLTPSRHDFYFGALGPNRVRFSEGRDIILAPPQDGPPVNYFVYPYVEVDGKPYTSVQHAFTFQDRPARGRPHEPLIALPVSRSANARGFPTFL